MLFTTYTFIRTYRIIRQVRVPVSLALCISTAFKCSGNTNYDGCTAVSLYCIYLQCTRARVLNPVGTRVSSVQMTLFGRLSFFPFLHLLKLFGGIHKFKIQGVFQTEYEFPFTVNIYNENTTLYVLFKLQPIGQSITGLLAEAYWSSTTNCS